MSRRVLLAGLLVVGALWATVALAQDEGDPVRGAALYAENCLACHGPQGEPLAAHEAFSAEIHYDTGFAETVAAGVEGSLYMKPWSETYGGPLSEADVNDLRAYARTWASGETPPLPAPEVPADLEPVGRGDPALGAALYQTYCAVCHGPEGQGRGDPDRFPAIGAHADVLTATRRGTEKGMPPFAQVNGGPLSETDITNIMAYVRTWERPSALQKVSENSPKGVGLLIWLMGIGAVITVGGVVMMNRSAESK